MRRVPAPSVKAAIVWGGILTVGVSLETWAMRTGRREWLLCTTLRYVGLTTTPVGYFTTQFMIEWLRKHLLEVPEVEEFLPCPECGQPTEILERFYLESTSGTVQHVRVQCIWRHHYTMPLEAL